MNKDKVCNSEIFSPFFGGSLSSLGKTDETRELGGGGGGGGFRRVFFHLFSEMICHFLKNTINILILFNQKCSFSTSCDVPRIT